LITDHQQEHFDAGDALCALWLWLEALTASVGKVPTCLAFDYLTPSAWASIGVMAIKLDEICKKVTTQDGRLDNYKEEIKMSVDHQVKLGQEDFYWRLEDFKIAFIQEM
jgi:hypothetical protein